MKILFSILLLVCVHFFFLSCNDEEQQSSTDQTAPGTLEGLLNPGTNSADAANSVNMPTTGSMNISDIWVLSRISGFENYDVNLQANVPLLDLDSAKRSLSGHTGCNSLGGRFRVQGNRLLFENVKLTSDQPCTDKGFEKKLLGSLRSGGINYKLLNDSLYLQVGGGSEFIYRRIRR